MTIKLDTHSVQVSVKTTSVDGGEIPGNLAKLTETIIALHKANGDIGWIMDMAHDAEQCSYGVFPWQLESGGVPDQNARVIYDDNGGVKEVLTTGDRGLGLKP